MQCNTSWGKRIMERNSLAIQTCSSCHEIFQRKWNFSIGIKAHIFCLENKVVSVPRNIFIAVKNSFSTQLIYCLEFCSISHGSTLWALLPRILQYFSWQYTLSTSLYHTRIQLTLPCWRKNTVQCTFLNLFAPIKRAQNWQISARTHCTFKVHEAGISKIYAGFSSQNCTETGTLHFSLAKILQKITNWKCQHLKLTFLFPQPVKTNCTCAGNRSTVLICYIP